MSIAAQLQPRVRAAAAARMAGATATMVTALDRAAPVKTGQLRRSRSVSGIRATGTGFSVTITYTAPQAGFTEDGTRPHTIRARRARVLAFKVGGRTVFAKSVRHPGTKAQHWFKRTVTAAAWSSALTRAG